MKKERELNRDQKKSTKGHKMGGGQRAEKTENNRIEKNKLKKFRKENIYSREKRKENKDITKAEDKIEEKKKINIS